MKGCGALHLQSCTATTLTAGNRREDEANRRKPGRCRRRDDGRPRRSRTKRHCPAAWPHAPTERRVGEGEGEGEALCCPVVSCPRPCRLPAQVARTHAFFATQARTERAAAAVLPIFSNGVQWSPLYGCRPAGCRSFFFFEPPSLM